VKDIPAFPVSGDWSQIKDKGMTLRDYFAAKAFQGLLSIYADGLTSIEKKDKDERFGTWISYVAYKMADEMLRARDK